MNILIVCGGTGGHLFPGIAVGEELMERNHQVLLVVSEKEVDQRAVQRAKGFLIQTLPAVGWKGWRPDRGLQFIMMMYKAVGQTKLIFRNFRPDLVLGMGGFSSVAPLLAAWRRKLPSCVHESNAIPGKVNRLAARLVSRIAVGFEAAAERFPKEKTVWTGTPVRKILRNKRNRSEVISKLGLSSDKPVVLVMGGSQGARGLNRIVLEEAGRINAPEIQWIHLTGVEDEKNVSEGYSRIHKTAKIHAFCHEMEDLYSVADLVIARSGAASLAEIAQNELPSILIPYPFAAENHQLVNARLYAETGAALVFEEAECKPGRLAAKLQGILSDPMRRKKMADATKSTRHDNAHKMLADMLEKLGKHNGHSS
jgi:UDP-N-acetylglucosamine--N-acetylmuramyl-(pentapeptide) pyrophosphoryl-undecaprenol N-acetylglucosamine transferase